MIYIDYQILSNVDNRLKMFTSKTGAMLLSDRDMNVLEHHFPGVGVKWSRLGGTAVEILPRPFKLTMAEGNNIILELDGCIFILPEPSPIYNKHEMMWMSFKCRSRK